MKILQSLAGQSVLLLGAVGALCGALGASEAWTKVVLALVPLLLGLVVHQVTSSPSTVARAVTDAATKTAAQLTDKTVGLAGQVTDAAANTATGVATEVIGAVGGLVPKLVGDLIPSLVKGTP